MTYSSSLAAGQRGHGYGRNQNGVAFRGQEKALGPISNTIILIVLALLLGLLYLTQATKTNAHGYQIEDLQDEQTALNAQHDDLAIASARLQSVERVQSSEVAKGLVSVAPQTTVQP